MQSSEGEGQRPAARVTRAAHGRVLGGVCAGLPEFWGLGTNGLRLLFVVGALCGGIGIVVYAACWLVIPEPDGEIGTEADPFRGIVITAWAACGLVAVALLAALGAAATIFGLGWVIVGLAAVAIALTFVRPLRIPRVAALAAVLALTLPAVAVALSPMRLTFQSGNATVVPASSAELSGKVFRSGFGTMLVDLRRTQLPSSGTVRLRIEAGLRRTIVALPSSTCVKVHVRYDVHTFTSQLAALLSGRNVRPFSDVVLFGRLFGGESVGNPHGTAISHANVSGPTLDIDFSSQGGGLYVRDYPGRIAPDTHPDWPGFPVRPEPRPVLSGAILRSDSRKLKANLLRSWRVRHQQQVANALYVNARMQGPCVQ